LPQIRVIGSVLARLERLVFHSRVTRSPTS
jgi:hypothetical protein